MRSQFVITTLVSVMLIFSPLALGKTSDGQAKGSPSKSGQSKNNWENGNPSKNATLPSKNAASKDSASKSSALKNDASKSDSTWTQGKKADQNSNPSKNSSKNNNKNSNANSVTRSGSATVRTVPYQPIVQRGTAATRPAGQYSFTTPPNATYDYFADRYGQQGAVANEGFGSAPLKNSSNENNPFIYRRHR